MRQFVFKVVLFALFIIAVDRVFILFKYKEKNLFNDISKNKLAKLAAHIHDQKIKSVDIAIYGSSHPQFDISPEIISSVTGKSCLNLAYGGGTNIGAQYEFIKKLDIKCRVLIYGIDVFSLNQEALKSDDFQAAFFNGPGSFNLNEDYLRYSNVYLYSHFVKRYIAEVKHGNFTLPYLRKNDSTDLSMFAKYRGYEINPDGWVKGNGIANKNYVRYSGLPFAPKKTSKEALEHITAYCRDKGITLIIVQTPEHAAALNYAQKYTDFDKWMKQFAADNKVKYLNFDAPEVFPVSNDSLFFDTDHLNARGAELFSTQLARAIVNSNG